MSLLIVDHYDSFTHLIQHELNALGAQTNIVQYDDLSLHDHIASAKGVIISPGPGLPGDYPASLALCASLLGQVPMLGICLGHQLLGISLGFECVVSPKVHHGHTSVIEHCGTELFEGLPNPLTVTRYHSWQLEHHPDRDEIVSAWSTTDTVPEVMAITDSRQRAYGVQFHPEAVLTQSGRQILSNFIKKC